MVNTKSVSYNRRAARKRKNRRIFKLSAVISFILIGVSFIGLSKSYAGTEPIDGGYDKVFLSEVVRADYNIYDIAAKNLPEGEDSASDIEDYMAEVARINHIYDLESIDAGNHIIVPSYR